MDHSLNILSILSNLMNEFYVDYVFKYVIIIEEKFLKFDNMEEEFF